MTDVSSRVSLSPDGKCSCTSVFWIVPARAERISSAEGSGRAEVTGLALMAVVFEEEEWGSDGIELAFLQRPPVHSDLLVIYLKEGIQ